MSTASDSEAVGTPGATISSPPAHTDRTVGESRRPDRTRLIGELIFVGILFALGLYCFFGALGIRVPAGSRVGPTVFPMIVSGLLVASSAAVLIGILRGRLGHPDEGEDVDTTAKTDWLMLGKLVGLVVLHLILIPLTGWAIAAALLFGGAAWSLGAKRWWGAILIGFAVGLVLQVLFGRLLGLSLPLGPVLGPLQPILGGV